MWPCVPFILHLQMVGPENYLPHMSRVLRGHRGNQDLLLDHLFGKGHGKDPINKSQGDEHLSAPGKQKLEVRTEEVGEQEKSEDKVGVVLSEFELLQTLIIIRIFHLHIDP